ncbi:hypothetical protein M2116_000925 [Aurantimicrobium minutum]|uniref:hypothetical protein n=1 Tax=Aurantimicrobium minutum TaxID=708131 RepID=UPI00240562B1|nr:hypothetical protein [Aurantimicrobium minutum]MDF9809969.1 hypothetical protein [Aurantimicrobium minutum]
MEISLLSDEQLSDFYSWPQERSFRLNMLLDSDDSSTGDDGTSNSLTSGEDRRLLRIIRNATDVLIVGAASIRAEGWFLPPQGRLAVLSQSGNIPWDSCPDSSRVSSYPSVSALLHSLRDSDKNILCEGGKAIAQLLSETIGFDDFALTRIGTVENAPLPDFLGESSDLALVSTLSDASHSMTFQYWRRAVEHQ